MKCFIITVVFTGAAMALSLGATQECYPPESDQILGSVDGKTYLANNCTRRTWDDAKGYCTSIGMKLASFTSSAQTNFIHNITHRNFQSQYWTAGRDARSHQQFVWDDDHTALSQEFVNIHNFASQATCLYYSSNVGYHRFYSHPCNDTMGTLCESVEFA